MFRIKRWKILEASLVASEHWNANSKAGKVKIWSTDSVRNPAAPSFNDPCTLEQTPTIHVTPFKNPKIPDGRGNKSWQGSTNKFAKRNVMRTVITVMMVMKRMTAMMRMRQMKIRMMRRRRRRLE